MSSSHCSSHQGNNSQRIRTGSGSENSNCHGTSTSPPASSLYQPQQSGTFEFAFATNNFGLPPSSSSTTTGSQDPAQSQPTSNDEDVFQCGKCKQRFFQLDSFFHHKGQCSTTLPDTEQQSSQDQQQHSAATTTSAMLSHHSDAGGGGGLLLGSNSIDSDLLSLASSLDPSAMLSLGNSISPSSILHLQGGDVSSNTDDFASFHQLATETPQGSPRPSAATQSTQPSQQQSHHHHQHQTHQQHSHHSVLYSTTTGESSSSIPTVGVDGFLDLIAAADSSNDSVLLKSAFDPTLASVGSGHHYDGRGNSVTSPSDYFNLDTDGSVKKEETSKTSKNKPSIVEHLPQRQDSVKEMKPMLPIQPELVFQIIGGGQQGQESLPSTQTTSTLKSTTSASSTSSFAATTSSSMFVIKHELPEENISIIESVNSVENVATTSSRAVSGRSNGVMVNKMRVNQCLDCKRTFSKYSHWSNHVTYHTGERPFLCILCGRALSCRPNLSKHIKTHGLGGTEQEEAILKQCLVYCELKIKERQEKLKREAEEEELSLLETKVNGLTGNGQLLPPIGTLQKVAAINSTIGSGGNDQMLKCSNEGCDLVLPDVNAFVKHIQLHDKQKQLSMSNNHTAPHAGGANNCLPIAGPSKLLTPGGSGSGVGGDNDTGTETDAENHKPTAMAKRIKPQKFFRCSVCLNRYSSPEALANHQASTTHRFQCEHCPKVFPCERYLRRHRMTHGADVYVCRFCDKAFKTANYLKVHIIIHTGEKPFTCGTCSAKFNRRDKLKRHELTHDPVKRYKCPLAGCTREFNRPDKFKAHLVTHSGVKPYSCNECHRCFTRRAHLREHHKTHTKPKKMLVAVEGTGAQGKATTGGNVSGGPVTSKLDGAIPVSAPGKSGMLLPKKEDILFINDPALAGLMPSNMGDISILSMMDGQMMSNYVLLFPCNECQQYFFKETDFELHPCKMKASDGKKIGTATTTTTTAISTITTTSTPIVADGVASTSTTLIVEPT